MTLIFYTCSLLGAMLHTRLFENARGRGLRNVDFTNKERRKFKCHVASCEPAFLEYPLARHPITESHSVTENFQYYSKVEMFRTNESVLKFWILFKNGRRHPAPLKAPIGIFCLIFNIDHGISVYSESRENELAV